MHAHVLNACHLREIHQLGLKRISSMKRCELSSRVWAYTILAFWNGGLLWYAIGRRERSPYAGGDAISSGTLGPGELAGVLSAYRAPDPGHNMRII